ncbi:MAG: 16S rRNA (cytosine(1402)-N(4))-methyltransferase RsmH [Anaerolineales bacterium]|nr:MAG: 16S rRNA (cytosine(1402)-N(4))-methyltransferase RsmH [Anaerolineales bacterium]
MQASHDAASAGGHTPVLYQKVLSNLNLRSGGRYIDGTVGAGGHAEGILEGSSPDGELLGIDRDPTALTLAHQRLQVFGSRLNLRHASYVGMAGLAQSLGWDSVDGILLDLGLSSMQVDQADRGFSFLRDGPLDMRFDPTSGQTAEEVVNSLNEADLREILWRLGEEPKARRIAAAIVAARPIHTTGELAAVVASVSGKARKGIHPATRSFQAFRIAVNNELEQLEQGLEQAVGLLAPQGRVAVIAFHSLEDRLVKTYFRRESQDCVCPPEIPVCVCDHKARLKLITPRPIKPDTAESERNPRSRSARLRIAELLTLA